MDIAEFLKKESEIPFERLRVVRHLDELRLSSIRRGIVFIFAIWSGPAVIAFRKLTQHLADIDSCKLDLVVLDTDCLSPDDGRALWGTNVGGGGETLWISNGVVIARAQLYKADSEPLLIQQTQKLLDESAS